MLLPSVPERKEREVTGGALNVDFAVWAMGLFYVGMFVALICEHIFEGK